MSRTIRIASALLGTSLALTLSGCAGKLTRPSTDGDGSQAPGVLEELQALQSTDGKRAKPRTQGKPARTARRPAAAAATKRPQAAPKTTALPTREPAQIMRIRIAPWEDAAGNLHGASDVFTEIVPNRWRMASVPGAAATTLLTPLQIEPRKAPDTDRGTAHDTAYETRP
jgi:hypothetical protein